VASNVRGPAIVGTGVDQFSADEKAAVVSFLRALTGHVREGWK